MYNGSIFISSRYSRFLNSAEIYPIKLPKMASNEVEFKPKRNFTQDEPDLSCLSP